MSDATTFPAIQQPGANHGFGNSAFQHTSLDPDASARLAAMDRALTEDAIFPSQLAPEFLHPEKPPSGSQSDSESQSVSHAGPPEEDSLLATQIAESAAAQDKPRATVQAAENQGATDPAGPASATDAPEIEFSEIQSRDMESAQPAPAETVLVEPAVGEVTGIFSVAEAGDIILHHQSALATTTQEISLIETTIIEADLNSESEAAAPAPLEVAPILDASGELEPEADQYTPPAPF